MKTVFKDHSELAHIWAQQNQEHGVASNMFFRGDTIYSYGTHFPIARFVDKKTVLFTTKNYSISTSKHKTHAMRAISDDCNVFFVPDVCAFTKEHHLKNYDYLLSEMHASVKTAIKSRRHASQRVGCAVGYLTTARAYNKQFRLRQRPPLQLPDYDKLQAVTEKQAEKARILEIARKERDKKDREFVLSYVLPKWKEVENGIEKDGKPIDLTRCFGIFSHAFLRVKKQNGTKAIVETSKGASVVVKTNGQILPFVADVHAMAMYCIKTESEKQLSLPIGEHYTLNRIDENGNLYIGCHVIPFSELDFVVKSL